VPTRDLELAFRPILGNGSFALRVSPEKNPSKYMGFFSNSAARVLAALCSEEVSPSQAKQFRNRVLNYWLEVTVNLTKRINVKR
jgi:hypothetical protein